MAFRVRPPRRTGESRGGALWCRGCRLRNEAPNTKISVTDLAEWLERLGLEKYAASFAEQEIDFDVVPLLTEADLTALGLPIGPRRKLLQAIQALDSKVTRPLIVRQDEAERRQLTIMFVDLANSTPLA